MAGADVATVHREAASESHAGSDVPAWDEQCGGPPRAVTTVVLALRRRRGRARGVYLLNARRPLPGPLLRLAPEEGGHVERVRPLVSRRVILRPDRYRRGELHRGPASEGCP